MVASDSPSEGDPSHPSSSSEPPPTEPSNVVAFQQRNDAVDGVNVSDDLSAAAVANANTPTESAETSAFKHILIAGVMALVINLIIAALKLGVHKFYAPSSALFSEGLHSLGDALNSVILLMGIFRGNRQPDRRHPFGYGLEANLFALLASFLLFFSAGWAMWEAVQHLLHPHPIENIDMALYVLAISMIFELYAIWTAARAILSELGIESGVWATIPNGFRYYNKAKAPTTRYVFVEDTLAFIGAFIATIALLCSHWLVVWGAINANDAYIPDAVGSLLVGVLLFVLASKLFAHNKSILMGSSAPAKMEKAIRTAVLNLYGVSHIHHLSTLDQGHSGLIIHMTVEVEPDLPVKDMDDLTERIKQQLAKKFEAVRTEQVFIEVQADESEEKWDARFEHLLEDGLKREIFRPRHAALLRHAHEFSELSLRDVMIPRTDVDYVNINTPLLEVAELMTKEGHTRWPVFRENVDDLMGIVHARDVFQHVFYKQGHVQLSEILREIHSYPETKPVSDLLDDFKREKLQIAAVADEYGGFAGIVTIEDLMEEIIGDIWDENEEVETWLEALSEHQYRVNGRYNLEDLNDELYLNIPNDDFVTIGGFLFGQLGREPDAGDTVIFEDITFAIETVDGPRIETILMVLGQPVHSEDDPIESSTADDADAPSE